MDSPADIVRNIVVFFPAFLFALVVHEFGHAWAAKRFGDNTSEWQGRLTLNPVAHMDPFGTVLFPMISIVTGSSIFFGWAKPVPIDTRNFTHYRKGLFWVSAAGVIVNTFMGFASAIMLVGIAAFVPESFGFKQGMVEMIRSFLLINFSLAVFNLLPIPPLDGSNIVMSFLPIDAARKFEEFQQYSFYLLIFLMISGVFKFISIPVMFLYQTAISLALLLFGLPMSG
jgi:Zn-dependent protease